MDFRTRVTLVSPNFSLSVCQRGRVTGAQGRKTLFVFFLTAGGSCTLKGLWEYRSRPVLLAIWPPGSTAAFRLDQLVTNLLEPFSVQLGSYLYCLQIETRGKRQENKLAELVKHSSACAGRNSKGSACQCPRRGAAAVHSCVKFDN